MLNKFIVQGRLVRDVNTKETGNSKYVFFTLASNFNKDKVNFIDCKAFGKTAEIISKYVTKGKGIIVEGIIESGSFEKDGKKVFNQSLIVNNVYFNENKSIGLNQIDEKPESNEDELFFD